MKNVVVFGFDIREASQIRSIRAIRRAGVKVSSFSFRRENMNAGFEPDWPDTPLGRVNNGDLLRRLPALAKALLPVWRERQRLRGADVIVARNFDMLLVALASKMLSLSRAPVVYQCLDIHSIFTNSGFKGHVIRAVERLALCHVSRLVISSSGFLRNYFEPVQRYRGATTLLENRIVWNGKPPARPVPFRRKPGPIRVGWVGTLRCPQSFDLLTRTADLMGDQVEIILRGVVHNHTIPDFHAAIATRSNMRFEGGYNYPDGLKQAYTRLDMVWAQDLWQSGGNSDWLLPNRIYEAGFFGCPSIAVTETETGRRIAKDQLGFVINQPDAVHLVRLLRNLSVKRLQQYRFLILKKPASHFCQQKHEITTMLEFSKHLPKKVLAHA